MTLATLLVKLVGDATQLDAELKRSQRQLAATSAQWQQFGQSMQQIGTQLTAAVSLPLAGLGAVALKTAGELEQNTIAFKTMLGSAERATDHLAKLRDFAMKTPFQFTDLVLASKRLQALGFTAAEVLPTLKAVGNATAALGTGAEGIQRITLALGQMAAKGKVQAEEMRQLAEAGIPAWQILAKTLKTDVAGAMALVEKRAVDSATAIPAILAGINERFAGLMDEQSKTLLGRWSNFKDQMTKILSDIGAALTPLAGRLMDAMVNLGKEAEVAVAKFRALPQVIQDASVGIGLIAVVAGPALFVLGQMSMGFSALITLGSKLAGIMGLAGLAGAVTALGTAAAVVGGAIALWKLGEIAIVAGRLLGQLIDFGKAVGPLREVTDWIGRMAKAVDDFYDRNGGRPNIWASILPGFGAFDEWLGMFVDRTKDLADDSTTQLKRLSSSAKSVAADMKESLDKKFGQMADAVKAAHDRAAASAAEFAKKLARAYSALGIETNKVREIHAALAMLAQRQKQLGESVPALMTPYAILRREFDAGRLSAEQFRAAIHTVGEALGKVKSQQVEFDFSVNKVDLSAINEVISKVEGARSFEQLSTLLLGTPESWLILNDNMRMSATILQTLGLEAQIAAGQTALAFDTLGIKSQASLRDLAQKAQQAFDEIRTAGTSTPLDIRRAWVKMIEAQIEAGERLPKETLRQYEKIKAATSSATGQIDKQWRVMLRQISTAINDLSKSFTDVIFGTKKLSEAFEDLGKTIVRIILEQIIANAIGKLMKALSGVLDHLGAIGKALGSVFGGASSAAGSVITGAGGVLGTSVGAAGGAVGSGAGAASGGAASGANSAVGGVAGWVGIGAQVASAVSSVIGNFQMAHMNTALGRIEESTRYAKAYLFDLIDNALKYWPQLENMRDFNYKVQAPLLTSISSSMDFVVLALADIRAWGGKSGGGNGPSTYNITINVDGSGDPAAVADEVMRRLPAKLKTFTPAFAAG